MAKGHRITAPITPDDPDEATCPIANLALDQMALWEAHKAVERKAVREGVHEEMSHPYRHEYDSLWARIQALEEEATWHYAHTLRGAMFQTVLALGVLSEMDDMIPEDHETYPSLKRTERYLFSILKALEVESAINPQECGSDLYIEKDRDTLLPIETALIPD